MAPDARRRACVAFRAKLSRDTGTDLTAAACEELLSSTFTFEVGRYEYRLPALKPVLKAPLVYNKYGISA
jgi:hypothetical protein